MKTLTLVIPAYNSEKFLDKCIPSMISPETLGKVEIVIINDGSTDETAVVAEKYRAMYPETVQLISQENKGHGGALNTGCAAAQGKYLKVIDADDWIVTENLPEFVDRLEQCSADVILTHYHTINVSTGERKSWRSYPAEFGKSYSFEEIMREWKNYDRCLTFHGITYRTEFYRTYGVSLSEHVFYEDHEYAAFPCCHAQSIVPLDLFVYEYRIGDVAQSVSEENQLKRIGHTEAVLKKMMDEYKRLSDVTAAQKLYVAMKIQGLLLSYMKTALLVHPKKKTGRATAKRMMELCRGQTPQVYELTMGKVRFFYGMNRLHLGQRAWEGIMDSRIYNFIRKRHTFK